MFTSVCVKSLAALKKQQREIDARLEKSVADDTANARMVEILNSVTTASNTVRLVTSTTTAATDDETSVRCRFTHRQARSANGSA